MYEWSKAKKNLGQADLENLVKKAVISSKIYGAQNLSPEIGLHPLREGLPRKRQDPCGVCGEYEDSRDPSRIIDHRDHLRTEVLIEGRKNKF